MQDVLDFLDQIEAEIVEMLEQLKVDVEGLGNDASTNE